MEAEKPKMESARPADDTIWVWHQPSLGGELARTNRGWLRSMKVIVLLSCLAALWGTCAMFNYFVSHHNLKMNLTIFSSGNQTLDIGSSISTVTTVPLVARDLYVDSGKSPTTTGVAYLPTPSPATTIAAADALSGLMNSSATGTASLTEADSDTTLTTTPTSTGIITEVTVTPFMETSTYTDDPFTDTAACSGPSLVTVTIEVTVDPLSVSETDTPLTQFATSSRTFSPVNIGTSEVSATTESQTIPIWTTPYNFSVTVPPGMGTGPTAASAAASGSWLTVPSHNGTYTPPTAVPHHTAVSAGSDSGMPKAVNKLGNGGGSAVSYCVMMMVLYTVLGIF